MLALLIDISAKQEYIFSSTKLKDNIGASNTLAYKIFSKSHFDMFKYAEIVFIGGGNAMLLFNDKAAMVDFIKGYSTHILKDFPGIKLNFGWTELKYENELNTDWKGVNTRIQDCLTKKRNQEHVLFRPIKLGFVDDCKVSGEAQEAWLNNEEKFVSKELKIKRDNCSFIREYRDWDNTSIEINLPDNYVLSEDLNEIIPDNENAYMAVVHIDGNGLGKMFMACKTKKEFQDLSKKIKLKLADSLEQVIVKVAALFDDDGLFAENTEFEIQLENNQHKKEDERKFILPIRPIINAGDDITLVCHGKLGLWVAENYMDILKSDSGNSEDTLSIPCSAGVAIIHKKFPFAKAYDLAENLAAEAKQVARKSTQKNVNWINFIISPEGYSGDYQDFISRHYVDNEGHILHRGPYMVQSQKPSFSQLKETLYKLQYADSKISKNKFQEIRTVLSKPRHDQLMFELHMKARDEELEHYLQSYPYFDLVEMRNFYPQQLLQ